MNKLYQLKASFAIWLQKQKSASTKDRITEFLLLAKKGGLYLLLFFFVFYLAVFVGLFGKIPSQKALLGRKHDRPSEVYSVDGVLLGRYFLYDKKEIAFSKISPHVISALIATEDVRFYSHQGIDGPSMFRVLIKSLLLQQSSSGGGSTITQQLAKSLYPRRNYWLLESLIFKIREIIIAKKLEAVYSKEEILELYLNSVHMGGNVFGIERGSWTYFNKPAISLNVQEAALLVGMLKASTKYNPLRNPEASKSRRNVVIAQMVKAKTLSAEEGESLMSSPLRLKQGKADLSNGSLAQYFRQMLKTDLLKWCQDNEKEGGESYNLYHDGLKIYTTIDSKAQQLAELAVRQHLSSLQTQFNKHWGGQNPWGNNDQFIEDEIKRTKRYKLLADAGKTEDEINKIFNTPVRRNLFSYKGTIRRNISPRDSIEYYQRFLNTGLIAMEPETGHILAWVGGIDQKVFNYDHVNSKRQVGSTFKPILYAAALEDGMEPCKIFENKQATYDDGWTPKNADGQYGGQYTMVQALAHSVNTISAQIIDEVGVRKTISLAQDLGIESELPKVQSIALGSAEISLIEMVTAYSTLANKGLRTHPVYFTKITDNDGEVLHEYESKEAAEVMDPDNAATIIQMMRAVVEEGSAHRLRTDYHLQMDIAGKTGTTQNQSDGWFIGIIPGLVTGVWVGGENPAVRFRTLKLGQGSNTALPVWGKFISRYSNSYAGKQQYNSRFPALNTKIQNKLSCLNSEPVQEEEYYTNAYYKLPKEDKKSQDQQRKLENKYLKELEKMYEGTGSNIDNEENGYGGRKDKKNGKKGRGER
jgi:penicillin-binding protein 1A